MIRSLFAATLLMTTQAVAQAPVLDTIVDDHILPGYRLLFEEAGQLVEAAQNTCDPTDDTLRAAYHDAFDAWVGVSHLRFGPSEENDRAFALAFWPDPRGSTPKTLARLIANNDEVVSDPNTFETVSVAARGFYALEFLLYDPQFTDGPTVEYRCALLRAISEDIFRRSVEIRSSWRDAYGDLIRTPNNDIYRTDAEAAQQLFTALVTGLEFTETQRLARPLGTFERPRPNRAEARRSGRSLRHVVLSLEATRDLAFLISADADLDADFAEAIERAISLDDPVFASVADPAQRFKIEVLQQNVTTLRRYLLEQIGPRFGITAGFNSLDGD